MKSVKTGNSKGVKRRAILILAIFIIPSVMGSAALVLSEWNPNAWAAWSAGQPHQPGTKATAFVGTGSGTTESASSNGECASLGDNAATFDVGQSVSWSGSVSASDTGTDAVGYLYYQGSDISTSSTVSDTGIPLSRGWSASHTFGSSGRRGSIHDVLVCIAWIEV